jgi:adenosine deaminase
MRVETIIDIATTRGVSLPHMDVETLGAYLKVGMQCKDLVDFLKLFAVTVSVLQDRESLIRAVYELRY